MITIGTHLYKQKLGNSEKSELIHSYRVCLVNRDYSLFAVADMLKANLVTNPPKPEIFTKTDLNKFINKNKLEKDMYDLPSQHLFSDERLKATGYGKWLKKRDEKFAEIKSLTSQDLLEQYLFGKGLGDEIRLRLVHSRWSSHGAFNNALNRFIIWGAVPNALISFKSHNIGTMFPVAETCDDVIIKRGRGGKNNQNSRTVFRGITEQDKTRIKQVTAKWVSDGKKLSLKRLYECFEDNFFVTTVVREINGKELNYYSPFDQKERISFRSFSYHFNQFNTKADLLKMKFGHISFEKDHADRQGSAIDGVLGATHRYEVDATVLDVYVRYPYDKTGRFTMGRPVLYLVIDVYSTMIVGFYLGFDGPNSDGVAQAMVNACMCKVEFAKRYNLDIDEDCWPAQHIPREITIDNGSEYPNSAISSALKSMLGIIAYNFAAVFRGDAKGTVESKFNALNNLAIHFIPGAIFKQTDRTEQHPSNRSMYSYDDLMRELILMIIQINKSGDRLHRLNFQATIDDIGISPQSLFLHSLEKDMDGGNRTQLKDKASLHWAFLKEEKAKVQSNGVVIDKLRYHSDYFKQSGMYARAKHHGRFEIDVKRVKDWVNDIFYLTDSSEYIKLTLVNVNNESPFANMHWESVLHLNEWNKIKYVKHAEFVVQLRQELRNMKEPEYQLLIAEINKLPENTRKSLMPNIKNNKAVQKHLNTLTHASDVMVTLGVAVPDSDVSNVILEDNDWEGF
jgi:hypothetical protein